MVRSVLYVRVDERLKKELWRLSRESGMPLAQVAEIIISRGLGKSFDPATERVNELLSERFGSLRNEKKGEGGNA